MSDWMFQHTATRRWLRHLKDVPERNRVVSTHSHPKVAAEKATLFMTHLWVSTHSHPKVAATVVSSKIVSVLVSTHSHPKVAANFPVRLATNNAVSTHSHPKVAALAQSTVVSTEWFQHTATRRWLRAVLPS